MFFLPLGVLFVAAGYVAYPKCHTLICLKDFLKAALFDLILMLSGDRYRSEAWS